VVPGLIKEQFNGDIESI